MRHFNNKIKKYLQSPLKNPNVFMINSTLSADQNDINYDQKFLNDTLVSPEVEWYQQNEIKLPYIGYTLLLIDFDIPADSDKDYWVHWFIPFIPKRFTKIPEMICRPQQQSFKLKKYQIKNGKNGGGTWGYSNPCPPKKTGIHNYYLFIFGVNKKIDALTFEDFLKEVNEISCFGYKIAKYSNDHIKKLSSKSRLPKKKNKSTFKNLRIGGMLTSRPLKPCDYQKLGYGDQGEHSLDPIYQVGKLNSLPFIPNFNTC